MENEYGYTPEEIEFFKDWLFDYSGCASSPDACLSGFSPFKKLGTIKWPFGKKNRKDKKSPSGAENAATARQLEAQLVGEELSGPDGHAFKKHVVEKGEFPGIRTRGEFAEMVENVVLNGERRFRRDGASAYWHNGVIVIRNPNAADGGSAFKAPYDYFETGFQRPDSRFLFKDLQTSPIQ